MNHSMQVLLHLFIMTWSMPLPCVTNFLLRRTVFPSLFWGNAFWQYFCLHWCCTSFLKEILFPTCHYFRHHWWRSSYLKEILDFSSFSRKALPPQSEMTSVFLSHRSDFTFLSGFPSSYLIFQFLAFDPNSRFKTQISSSKMFTSV